LGALTILVILWAGYLLVTQPITLVINDQPRQIRTRYQTVAAVMQEWELSLEPEDIVVPAPGTTLASGDAINIQLAQPVIISADGQTQQLLTHQQSIGAVLAEAGITTNPRDEIFIDQRPTTPQSALPAPPAPAADHLFTAATPKGKLTTGRPGPVSITIHRAIPLSVHDEGTTTQIYSAQSTVADALDEQGIALFPEDKVTPVLNTRLSPGMEIKIERSIPVSIKINNHNTLNLRTRAKTVGELLARQGVALMGQDYTRPALNQPVAANNTIEIVRVREAIEIAQEITTFESQWIPDETIPLDQQEVRQTGQNGVLKSRTRVRYENGQEISRVLEDKWLDQEAQNRVIAYGTQITIRTLETPDGPLEYWRKFQALTTGYSAATSGKAPDHPRYGITRSGLPAGRGIVAVDPAVIPLMTNIYVPGYGKALAGDTGGRVLGRHVDLGFDEDEEIPPMYGWRDVYILTPVPAADQIRYVLPRWPQR
jgi:uncharacterized protein YabE (DUF348 family)